MTLTEALDLADELELDLPHAYALLEGQPCSCATRYYGGDCAHTTSPELEEELTQALERDRRARRDREIVSEADAGPGRARCSSCAEWIGNYHRAGCRLWERGA